MEMQCKRNLCIVDVLNAPPDLQQSIIHSGLIVSESGVSYFPFENICTTAFAVEGFKVGSEPPDDISYISLADNGALFVVAFWKKRRQRDFFREFEPWGARFFSLA